MWWGKEGGWREQKHFKMITRISRCGSISVSVHKERRGESDIHFLMIFVDNVLTSESLLELPRLGIQSHAIHSTINDIFAAWRFYQFSKNKAKANLRRDSRHADIKEISISSCAFSLSFVVVFFFFVFRLFVCLFVWHYSGMQPSFFQEFYFALSTLHPPPLSIIRLSPIKIQKQKKRKNIRFIHFLALVLSTFRYFLLRFVKSAWKMFSTTYFLKIIHFTICDTLQDTEPNDATFFRTIFNPAERGESILNIWRPTGTSPMIKIRRDIGALEVEKVEKSSPKKHHSSWPNMYFGLDCKNYEIIPKEIIILQLLRLNS